ncbi:FAD:protein FMN transferase [Ulvibacterium sp.]|uniref:FAD:protein FMN transferase n=1 Tax=Ulvibacterium sp. TaxID=2665914 RepID=UPI00262243EF|nr:FAD:protein FMN transferase [Ulvibacterium sp.]
MTDLLKFMMNRLGFFLISAIFVFSCSPEGSKLVRNGSAGGALGTSYSIIYLSKEEQDFQKEIDSVFDAVNKSLSTYLPDSDISKINGGDTTVVVDKMFKEVFELSKKVYRNTDGYFDPTVGVLVNAWGFGPSPSMKMDSTAVDSLLTLVGFEKVNLTKSNRIKKTDSNIYLDFNAIAKGYAIDRLAVFLDEKEISDYLIEVGGELVGKGENRIKGKPWVVGIDDPQIEEGRRLKILMQLKDRALASSGNYRKFRIDSVTGKKYVHTIDPKSGFTKNGNTLGTTVLANTCGEADAYATAFMAMDLQDVLHFLDTTHELDAYIVYLNETGEAQEFMTPGFKDLVLDPNG